MLLFMDTETTGLYKWGLPLDHPSQPALVQLSCILCDDSGGTRGTLDLIVKPEGHEIPPESSEIHGITTTMAERYGVPPLVALACFNALAGCAERIIGYNVGFDMAVINTMFERHKKQNRAPRNLVDVMIMARDQLKLPPNFEGGDYKWPKLEQAYEFLTGKSIEGAHDALVDVRATMDCYYKMLEMQVPEAKPPRMPRSSSISDWGDANRNYARLRKIIADALLVYEKLPAWEQSFIADLDQRSLDRGDQLKMSDRQWQILERIKKDLENSDDSQSHQRGSDPRPARHG